MAISIAPRPAGVQFLRLGLALAAAGKKDDAEQNCVALPSWAGSGPQYGTESIEKAE